MVMRSNCRTSLKMRKYSAGMATIVMECLSILVSTSSNQSFKMHPSHNQLAIIAMYYCSCSTIKIPHWIQHPIKPIAQTILVIMSGKNSNNPKGWNSKGCRTSIKIDTIATIPNPNLSIPFNVMSRL